MTLGQSAGLMIRDLSQATRNYIQTDSWEEATEAVGSALISEGIAAIAGAYKVRYNINDYDTHEITKKIFELIGKEFNYTVKLDENPKAPVADEHINVPGQTGNILP